MDCISLKFRRAVIECGFVFLLVAAWPLLAADSAAMNKSGNGSFVSFQDGTLTIKGKSGLLVYDRVGENYKTYQNNEDGPGSKLVDTVEALSGAKLPGNVPALSRVLPGSVVRVNVEEREIYFGLDHRYVGNLVSYEAGKLKLVAAAAPPGYVNKAADNVSLSIDPSTPVLESVDGGDLKFAGLAKDALKNAKPGVRIIARSEYDADGIDVIEIGEPKRRMERYIGQTRGPVRGTFVSFKDRILRIQGKGVNSLTSNEYDRLIAWRIADGIPIFESIDGGAYQPADIKSLETAKEGTIVTIRKIEDVIIDVKIGVAR